MTETLLDRVLRHEGFEPYPYEDSVGVMTIGHGLTHLSEEESAHIVSMRLDADARRLVDRHGFLAYSPEVLDVTAEMCFQLGWTGCHKFTKMWSALAKQDYTQASIEMLDSKWHQQTKARCEELAEIIRSLA